MTKPEKKFFNGAVSAAVFANNVKSTVVRKIELSRRYQAGKREAFTHTLLVEDLPAAIAVLEEVQEYLQGLDNSSHAASSKVPDD